MRFSTIAHQALGVAALASAAAVRRAIPTRHRKPAMTTITMEEAQAKLPQLIGRLAPGEEITILDAEGRRAVAKLVGQDAAPRRPRKPGSARGKLEILKEDDEHLKDFEEHMRF